MEASDIHHLIENPHQQIPILEAVVVELGPEHRHLKTISLVLLLILELHILKFGILYPANLQEDVIAWHRLCCKYWWDWNSDWDTP